MFLDFSYRARYEFFVFVRAKIFCDDAREKGWALVVRCSLFVVR